MESSRPTGGAAETCDLCSLHTRHYHLRSLGRSKPDIEYAYRLLTDERVSAPFRWHGASISIGTFEDELLAPLLLGFCAISRRSLRPIGLTLITSPDLRDGHAYISVVSDPDSRGTGRMIEALIATIEYAFSAWPFHKLNADVDELALRQFGSALRRGVVEEGVFKEHVMRQGRRLDVRRLAVFRDHWMREGRRFVTGLDVEIMGRCDHG